MDMAFQLKIDEPVAKGIRRIARKEIDKAREQLAREAQSSLEEVIHAARKRFKKLRAVMRLVRGSLGGKVYRRENTAFRDAGRPLSEVRDAHAPVLALDKLHGGRHQEVPAATWSAVRRALEEREQEVNQEVLHDGGALGGVIASLEAARRRVKRWPLGGGFSALRPGLKRAYRRGRRAFAVASEAPTDENLHEWRKRVQDLRHHLALLQPARPGVLGELAERAHALSDHLGDDHDLAVLRQVLPTLPEPLGSEAQALLPLIDHRRGELRQAAGAIAGQVYRDAPGGFIRRVGAYWQLWHWAHEVARLEGKEEVR